MKELIEDYKRRLATVNEMLEQFNHGNGSINDAKKEARLNTKASEYRTFIAEMERIEAGRMKNYFEVEDIDTHRIHVKCGENARVVLIETAEGFIVDIYRNTDDELLDTMTVWNDDIFDNGRDFTDDLSEDEQPDVCKPKATTLLVKEDIQNVADSLKMKITDDRITEILESYDEYRKQYPDDTWREIVEMMLYNFLPK